MKSLSTKIGLGYFFIICINIAIAVFAIFHIHRLGSPVERVLKEKYQNVSAAENMAQALDQQFIVQQAMVDEGFDSSLVINFNTYKNEFYNWHQRAIAGIALPSEPLLLDSIMTDFHRYLHQSDSLLVLLKTADSRRSAKIYLSGTISPEVKSLGMLCTHLKMVNEQAISAADQRARQYSSQATFIIIVISVLAILLSIFASIRFTRTILRPVRKTTETVRRIGRGQLNQKIEIVSDDEIAELGREFNKMTSRLEAYQKMNIDRILREKKKSEAIVAGIPVSIIVTDEDNRLSLMNELAMKVLDIPDGGWQGKTIRQVVPDQQLANLLSAGEGENETSKDAQRSLISITKDEQELHFFLRRIRISDNGGQVLGVVTLLQDVTSFKNLDRLKSEFMATISHEIKTPLTSINMVVDILLKGVRGELNDDQRDLLTDAKKDCQRLRGLVTDLLDLSKLESGKNRMNFRPIKFDDLLDDALQPLRLPIREKQIELNIHADASLPEFEADVHHLSRVLTNLLENAVQHTPVSGKITVEARIAEDQFRICVADNGPGIPEDALDLIFDKFVQVKNFKDAAEGNIGLGLAISKEIIRAHGGEVWVESQVGQGSRFYFAIPLRHPIKERQGA